MGKQMEGGNRERRQKAKEAREAGELPSERGDTLGASKQRDASGADTHDETIEQKREGKQPNLTENTPSPKPDRGE